MSRALPDLPERPSVMARRLWYDTLVQARRRVAERGRVIRRGSARDGSDYPALQHFDGTPRASTTSATRVSAQKRLEPILHVNAPGLFGLG